MIARPCERTNLNIHIHALVLDGMCVEDGQGGLRFQEGFDRATEFPLDEVDVPAGADHVERPW